MKTLEYHASNLSCSRVIKAIAIAIALGVFCSNQPLPAQTTLSGVSELSTDSSGNWFNGSEWNTLGGDSIVNIFMIAGPNMNDPFINGPGDAQSSINIPLTPGIHIYTMMAGAGGFTPNHGMNLFFDGNNATPRISVFGLTQTNAGPPLPAFGSNGSASTFTLDGATVAGANSLSYQDGNTLITLTDYRWARPSVYNLDRISALTGDPGHIGTDGVADWVGQFTLDVTVVPEPGACTFLALGIAGFAVLNRRKAWNR